MPYRSRSSEHVHVTFDQSIPDPITGEIQTSMTKQAFAEESQINNIMAKYEKTGVIDHVKEHGGYSMMPSGLDYHTAMQLTIDAHLAFDQLPANIRKEFGNDAFEFLTFVEDPDNVERMAELGLITPEETEPERTAVPDETPPPAEEPSS